MALDFQRWREEWGDLLIASILSFTLFQLNMLVLFCIPLQILFVRKGDRYLLYGSVSVLITIVIVSFIRTASIEDPVMKRSIQFADVLLPAIIVAGVVATDLRWKIRPRTLYKVLVVSLGAGIISIPIILLLSRSDGFHDFLTGQVESVAALFQAGRQEGEAGIATANVESLVSNIKVILLRNYLFVYFITVAGSVWAGRAIAARMARTRSEGFRNFHIPDRMIWPLLISWALVLVDNFISIGAIAYAAWNIGLILLSIYGMQGIGIIQTVLDRRNVSKYFRILITAAMVMMVFWPGVNLVILIGLPILGVSELWVHFRKVHKE